MPSGWGAVVALVVLGLSAADAPSPAPAPMAAIHAATQPTLSQPASGTAPADDDTRDVDSDDDSDDDASLTAAIAVELPRQRRLAYRATASLFRAPPDARELLRPPQPGVDWRTGATTRRAATDRCQRPAKGRFMPHTCLVVSDDEVFAVIRDLLASERRALFHAPSGFAALEWLSRRRGPTILLVDLPLADMSGAELIESVRADDELRHTVASVCLAAPGVRAPHRAFRVVRKPSTACALVSAVDDARRQLAVRGAAAPESALDRYHVWRSRRGARGALV